jgi:hypothetical protein
LRKLGRPRFIDKLPENFQHVGLIHLILPNARIIDVRRNPMSSGFAVFRQHFGEGRAYSYDLRDIGLYYRDYVDLMTHWDRMLPGRVHRVIYDDLVSNTEMEIRRLLDYCGLTFEPACLNFHESRRGDDAERRAGAPADLHRRRRLLAALRALARAAQGCARPRARTLARRRGADRLRPAPPRA